MARIRIRIRYQKRAAPQFPLAAVLLMLLALTGVGVVSPAPQAPSAAIEGRRHYYLTRTLYHANEVGAACAKGYHFASIWEIADTSALAYDRERGLRSPDSGGGPPVAIHIFGAWPVSGWVRTGYDQYSTEIPGRANCGNWLLSHEFAWGTAAGLPSDWTAGEQDVGVWDVGVRTCDTQMWVWCVQDDSLHLVFLPLILK